ncbi:MAG TPA: hypothetical protein VK081_08835, partial [Planctomycetota bacterium]|nr:hypothetical protein [Planctomycetota bacterium]
MTVPNVTVQVSQTSFPVGSLAPSFAANVTGAPVTVFQGTVVLPAEGEGYAGPLPWNIVVPFQTAFTFQTAGGALLIDIIGHNAPNGQAQYWLDAVEAGGSAVTFGRAGDNPSNDFFNLVASTGADLLPQRIAPGNTIEYASTLMFTTPPGALMLGVVGFARPVDLGPFGAPTHELYLDPLVFVPHAWQRTFIGWHSPVPVPVPAVAGLIDTRVYAQ